jgi:hypothetical protein
MGANQNSSRELGLCPKSTQRISLLARLRSHSYRRAIGPRNRVRTLESQRKAQNDVDRNTSETMETTIGTKSNSGPHKHFIEHHVGVFKEPS